MRGARRPAVCASGSRLRWGRPGRRASASGHGRRTLGRDTRERRPLALHGTRTIPLASLLRFWSKLTTPHKLQGRGALGKPSRAGRGVCHLSKRTAAPWQLHAVVRRRSETAGMYSGHHFRRGLQRSYRDALGVARWIRRCHEVSKGRRTAYKCGPELTERDKSRLKERKGG